MASRFTSISNIVASRIHWKLKCRIMRLWVVTNFNNPSTETSLEMLLVDEKGGKIHAHVKKSLINDFKTILEEGQTNVLLEYLMLFFGTKLHINPDIAEKSELAY
ncbi:hypothetical protein JHK82_035400 [Glycine max]|uniref:Replication protein A 70 kDa DNA-binding subunit B/D first OB fold domain-containing protein n=1 Tax=Glycine soja TaxID=3848 RepID=A0A0B2PCU5_GLYSO|nr:hypothetical protein JHK87_035328 [Glycine soja]KAG4969700.1 hypothetical protein JHK85_036121 [Glycine max]KAG4976057.1 hypothetical protein JHK86_035531 [Glycine max]KAG5112131.1 hypothetical protein JHK82_035400 [Glycine max]KAG5129414.1 hypothetical protein JHK84_035811 [Glycine max]